MSLVREIERLGAHVAYGDLTQADAVQRVMEYSDGGLTRLGAADLMASPAQARGRYDRVFDAARRGLAGLDP